jgi:NAD(P)-dependent dehydrogenase (short-subunit alcohol dehydrogenase family)
MACIHVRMFFSPHPAVARMIKEQSPGAYTRVPSNFLLPPPHLTSHHFTFTSSFATCSRIAVPVDRCRSLLDRDEHRRKVRSSASPWGNILVFVVLREKCHSIRYKRTIFFSLATTCTPFHPITTPEHDTTPPHSQPKPFIMAETHHFNASALYNMKDTVAVITGGGTGIGLMAAQALSANGAKVYIIGRRLEALEQAAKSHDPKNGGSIIPLGPCDVTKKDDLARTVKDLKEKEKYINLLVCNAGVGGPKGGGGEEDAQKLSEKLWENESVEEWNECYSTDVTSVYFTAVAFLPMLQAAISPNGPIERFGSSIITTSSMSGMMRHAQGHFAYNAAKAATVHLTKLMSAEFQPTWIRVNSIAPGYFPSEMTTKESDDKQKSELPAEQVQDKGHVPAMRGGREEEMGMAMLFLAANKYVNGQILAVDGGVLNVVGS